MSSDSNAPNSETTESTSRPSEPSIDEGRGHQTQDTRPNQDTSIVDSIQTTFNNFSRDQQIIVVGSIITVVGAFLPWATVLGTTVLGVSNGDGIVTSILAIIAAGAVYWEPLSGELKNYYVAAVAGIVTILLGLYSLTGVSSVGVYVTVVGGIIMAYPGVSTALSNYQRG